MWDFAAVEQQSILEAFSKRSKTPPCSVPSVQSILVSGKLHFTQGTHGKRYSDMGQPYACCVAMEALSGISFKVTDRQDDSVPSHRDPRTSLQYP